MDTYRLLKRWLCLLLCTVMRSIDAVILMGSARDGWLSSDKSKPPYDI